MFIYTYKKTAFGFFIMCLLCFSHLPARPIYLQWICGFSNQKNELPAKYYKAVVPGSCVHDYIQSESKQTWQFADNVKKYTFLEDKFWRYVGEFEWQNSSGSETVFISKGIDYEYEILINGALILHGEGMFSPINIVMDNFLKPGKNKIEIIIYPVPIAIGAAYGRAQAVLSAKPAVPYGWDWHPRLIPVGIWDETYIEQVPKTRILEWNQSYTLSSSPEIASVNINITTSAYTPGLKAAWVLSDKDGNKVIEKTIYFQTVTQNTNITIPNIRLWNPHDHGQPYCYTSKLSLINEAGELIDEHTKKIGFRRVELVMNEGAWKEPDEFPKTRSVPPFTLEINGKPIFAKGSNWVHPEIFYGLIDYDRYLQQLLLVKQANMNLLRVWGGGITNKEAFFSICDSLGIMVWQEFPLACNNYPNDAHYLQVLEQEATAIIQRVRQHPAVVMWSGGNELFNNWSKMTDQSHALRLLNALCYTHDRHTPFIMTSPVMGVAHGHYVFYDRETGEDVFQLMKHARHTAYTEFGMPSLAPVEVLKKIIPQKELFPPMRTAAWTAHHAFEAWRSESWSDLSVIEKYFGKSSSIEELVGKSQLLQAIGYTAIFEEARRQKPYCSMALNWCFNEPWPTAANNSIVAYPNIPKPSYYAVKQANRPVMASLAFDRFDFKAGTILEAHTWLLNDSYHDIEALETEIYLHTTEGTHKIGAWKSEPVSGNQNLKGPTFRYRLPQDLAQQTIRLSIVVKDKPEYNSNYYVLVYSSQKKLQAPGNLNH